MQHQNNPRYEGKVRALTRGILLMVPGVDEAAVEAWVRAMCALGAAFVLDVTRHEVRAVLYCPACHTVPPNSVCTNDHQQIALLEMPAQA